MQGLSSSYRSLHFEFSAVPAFGECQMNYFQAVQKKHSALDTCVDHVFRSCPAQNIIFTSRSLPSGGHTPCRPQWLPS
nr:MAG TPA: hypothetical protein [Caudoviricetes sp.]